jgi:uncharacterized membrane protein SpoIIM required for sporulation
VGKYLRHRLPGFDNGLDVAYATHRSFGFHLLGRNSRLLYVLLVEDEAPYCTEGQLLRRRNRSRRASSWVYTYADIESVYVSDVVGRGKITVKGEDNPIWLGAKPKSGSAKGSYDWLGKKLAGSGAALCLPEGGVPNGLSGPVAVMVVVPLAIFLVLWLGLIPFVSPPLLSVSPAILSSLAAFFFFVRRIAKKNDRHVARCYGKQIQKATWVDLRGHIFGRGARWIPTILLLEIVGTMAVAFLPFLPGESSHFVQLFQQQRQALGTTAVSEFLAIFANNLHVLIFNFIPVIGPLTDAGATYNTGRVIEAITQNTAYPLPSYFLYLFSLPHTWFELTAYAIGVFEAFTLPASWSPEAKSVPSRSLVSRVDEVIFVLAVAIGVLAVAGAFEVLEPRMANPYILWIPGITLIGIGFFAWFHYRSRIGSMAHNSRPGWGIPGEAQ